MAIPVGRNAGTPPAAAPPEGAGGDFQEVDDFQEVPGAPRPAAQAPPIPGIPPLAAPAPAPAMSPIGPRPGETFQVVTSAPELASQSTMERLDGVERTLEEAIRRIDTIDKFTEAVRSDINQVKESISHMEANMRELTSLYDLISSQVNPFIDMETAAAKGAAAEESAKEEVPEFDALFEPTPEMGGEGEFLPVEPGALAPALMAPSPEGLAMASEQMGIQALPGMPVAGVAPMPTKPQRMARLTQIGSDSMCLIALMRWIEFMLGRVKREQIPSLLGFYVRIGWISDAIKQHVMDVIRGIRFGPGAPVGGATGRTYGAYEAPKDKEGDVVMAYSKEAVTEVAAPEAKKQVMPPGDDWKLAPEDHLKTLIFIEKIRGTEVDKNKLEELERDVLNLRKGLDGFFGL